MIVVNVLEERGIVPLGTCERRSAMDIGSVVQASVTQSVQQVQSGTAIKVMADEMHDEKDLVSQIIGGGQQIASQLYNGHGQVVPTSEGANVDLQM
jgi:hypothetical protein